MKRRSLVFFAAVAAFSLGPACAPDTGGKRITFRASAGASGPATFENDRGWAVTLSEAKLTFGPVYLSTYVRPASALRTIFGPRIARAHDDGYVGDGRVVGELLSRVTVDLAQPGRVELPDLGDGVEDAVGSADVLFWPPPPYAPEATKVPDPALSVAGVATKDGETVRFRGKLFLDETWLGQTTPGAPGRQTLTELRTISGIVARFRTAEGGALAIDVSPAALFAGADFANLADAPLDPVDPTTRLLVQSTTGTGTDQVMRSLFNNLRASTGTWDVRWTR